MARRGELFLEAARQFIYRVPDSPYLQLLSRAGIELGDLEACVRRDGLERTLEDLRDEGVRVSLSEFRGQEPIRRPGLTIDPRPGMFVNPMLSGGVRGRSSGTSSAGTSTAYTWAFLAEEAAAEFLLHEQHGVGDVPLAMWMPGPPGIAGLHNLLLHFKAGRVPDRWFSQAPPPSWADSLAGRLAPEYLFACARLCGLPASRPRYLPVHQAREVAQWLHKQAGTAVLKTYASSAVRTASAAKDEGLDLSGHVIFTGGEPLTGRRKRFIESTGARVYARYVTTESGLAGADCGRGDREAPDQMHVYQDRLAIVGGQESKRIGGRKLRSLVFTTLSMHAPRILLNTELGDYGVLDRRKCDCLFGQLGMDARLSHVGSPEKLTAEGMNLPASEMDAIVGEIVEQAGGSPDDYQFEERQDERGITALTIVVSPAVSGLDEEALLRETLRRLEKRGGGAELAGRIWRDGGVIQVARRVPRPTSGYKMTPVVRNPS